ncbi:hypothetical protein [Streptomyces sp. B1I3]|uniref:hypothetical protein n=1 Tax=Streptomyces sp. B1I3 TaxID=3042264 RepID=UPI002788DB81|nr:hypothetical protein [Streptomyces sp. B1I3]MDQ0792048.1 hypothetical protein [Streptomyces sp. B1I3]
MTATETFGVYCAGEQLGADGPSITFIYVSTPLGQVRMTASEANNVGRALVAAAEYDRSINDETSTVPAGKRYRITDEHLRDVVAVYGGAREKGEPPTRAVAAHFDVAHSTAAKWLGHARKRALLNAWTVIDSARAGGQFGGSR